jgi:tetratricopeptide (TPR) repeat protein
VNGAGMADEEWMMRGPRIDVGRLARSVCAMAVAIAAGSSVSVFAQGEGEKPERHGVIAPPRTDSADLSPPPLNEGVLRALEASYLTDAERAGLRVFHGVWTAADLASAKLRAKAALSAGVLDDASFESKEADAEDRAEAALLRGEPEKAIEVLAGMSNARAVRVRAEALETLGKFDEALAATEPLVGLLTRETASAAELTEGVLAMLVRGRIMGMLPADFGKLMDLLSHAQQDLDRLYWPAVLAQARLLYDKDNGPDANKALRSVLSMNPSCASAWRMMGESAVSGFAFDGAEAVAGRLSTIASLVGVADRPEPKRAQEPEPKTVQDLVGMRVGEVPPLRKELVEGKDLEKLLSVPGSVRAVSLDGALILARARMRQNAPELAEEALAPVLARFPKHRGALALRAAVQAQMFDYAGTDERLKAFDALWAAPVSDTAGPTEALIAVGSALAEARQYDKAAAYLSKAAARNSKVPEALIELGLLYVQSGKDLPAKDALKAAVKLDPFNTRATNSLTLIEELATYTTFESPNFIVRCKPGVDEVVAKELIPPLERIHSVVCAAFEHTPAQRTVIELMPDHEWFAVRITGMPGIHTIAASTGPIIAMEAPRDGRGHYGVYDWERVVRHEFTHTVNLSQTGYRLPHWFTEAAAVSMEFGPYDFATCQLLVNALSTDTLFDLREINEAFVRPKKPTDRQQAYMQGNWMYRYISETWGKSAPVRLLERFSTGEREDKAFPAVLGVNTETFMMNFRVWARKDAASWGMLPEPSLDSLRLGWMLGEAAEREGLSNRLMQVSRDAATLIAGHARVEAPEEELGVELAPVLPFMATQWLEKHPGHPDLLELSLTDTMNVAGNETTPEVIAILDKYAAARPVDPKPHRLLAKHYLDAADDAEKAKAIPHLEYLDIREQYSPVYAAALAKLYAAGGDLDLAWKKVERATQISGYDPALREQAATIALRRKDYTNAERHIAALVVLEPNQPVHAKRLEAVRKMAAGG